MHPQSLLAYVRGSYAGLGVSFLIIYLWKVSGALWLPGISDHLSNFALTGLGSLVLIGPSVFISWQGRVKVLVVSGLFVLANLAVELMGAGTLGGFNILDGYDALYGVLACGIVIGVHMAVAKRKTAQ